jgi:prepilin signal peptidase PulO-like enzyme (type II secretory pathway)
MVYGWMKFRNTKFETGNKFEIQNPKIPFGAFLALSSLVVFAFKGMILQILDSWLTLNP